LDTEDTPLEQGSLFIDLILPVPVGRYFTYCLPSKFNDKIKVGQRAIVPFGSRKIITGIVANVHSNAPKDFEIKFISELLDDNETITEFQFRLFEWIADYYMCTLGEVLNAALPNGLKLSSESIIQINPSLNQEESAYSFSDNEKLLLNHLETSSLSYSEASKLLKIKSIHSILKTLTAKKAIIIFENVREKYKPKREKRIRLNSKYLLRDNLASLFDQLSQKPKQEAVILKFLQHVPVLNKELDAKDNNVSKTSLIDNEISVSSLNTLIKNGILEEFEVIVPRFGFEEPISEQPIILSENQEKARNSILTEFQSKETVLLHGITGSGKTEIYIDLIKRALVGDSQVLYILPEIALTTQIVIRLKKIFGNSMGVYHSKFSDNERVEVWNAVLQGKYNFVVGVRSSIFLPFDNLSLIVIDEEHEPSYKQQSPAPRYNARDVALVMARLHHAKVLMGTATPSCESYYNTTIGLFGYVSLNERFNDAKLPETIFADLSKERKKNTLKGDFSSLLIQNITETIEKQNQVILFQNRRGHSPLVQCDVCAWIPECINCAVSLTYHQFRHSMICHYCGYNEPLPKQCPKCTSSRILILGYGTEKLEEELKYYFPDINIGRMDFDTTHSRKGYEKIIKDFETGQTSILIGTQMVTKGLDFDKVTLVGIFNADRMMHFPNFRSHERAFQLILQVSGRAGRRGDIGKVVIQTANPQHPIFSYVRAQNVIGFITDQLADRKQFFYPPFSRLIEITVKHNFKDKCLVAANEFTKLISRELKGVIILGPAEPPVSKIRNQYLYSILLKIPRDKGQLVQIKEILTSICSKFLSNNAYRTVRISFDVDPV